MTEMVRWHHQLNGHEFEQVIGVGDGQGSLACCSPWGCKESDMTQQLNSNSPIHSTSATSEDRNNNNFLKKLSGI